MKHSPMHFPTDDIKDMGKTTRTKQIAVNKRVGVPDLTSLNDACTRYNMFDE